MPHAGKIDRIATECETQEGDGRVRKRAGGWLGEKYGTERVGG